MPWQTFGYQKGTYTFQEVILFFSLGLNLCAQGCTLWDICAVLDTLSPILFSLVIGRDGKCGFIFVLFLILLIYGNLFPLRWLCLVYKVSSRTARAIQSNSVSKRQKTNQPNKQKKQKITLQRLVIEMWSIGKLNQIDLIHFNDLEYTIPWQAFFFLSLFLFAWLTIKLIFPILHLHVYSCFACIYVGVPRAYLVPSKAFNTSSSRQISDFKVILV